MTVRQLLHRHFIERFQRGEMTEAVSSTALEHIESTLNVLLPASYRDFQETYGPVYTPGILDIVVLRKSPLVAVQEFLAPADVIESSATIGVKAVLLSRATALETCFALSAFPKQNPALMMPLSGCLITKLERHLRSPQPSTHGSPTSHSCNHYCKTDHQTRVHHTPTISTKSSFSSQQPSSLIRHPLRPSANASPNACRAHTNTMALTTAVGPPTTSSTQTRQMPSSPTSVSTSALTK